MPASQNSSFMLNNISADKNIIMNNIPGRRGMAVPITVVIILILALLGFSLYNFSRSERNIVARLQYASVADKMAQAAAQEAACWFNLRSLVIHDLLKKNDPSVPEKFVLLPLKTNDIEGKWENLTGGELKVFKIASDIGCRIESVELKYGKFKNFFNPVPEGNNCVTSCYLHPDPFERAGGLIITSKVTYKSVTRIFCCRYEIKITNTLLPVISKFTLFSKGGAQHIPDHVQMMGETVPEHVKYGQQGLAESDYHGKALRVPMIVVNHPDDVAEISGYAKSHFDIREYLPEGKAPRTLKSYMPELKNRGWIFMGIKPDEMHTLYQLNLAPGFVNPDLMDPYDEKLKHRFYGEGFQYLESDIAMLVDKGLKGNYPYAKSFDDSIMPGGIKDYILRIVHSGIYWLAMSDNKLAKKYLLGNYYNKFVSASSFKSERSSLLHLFGDMQPLAFSKSGRPSKYLDRRSPTVVFGRVWRSYMQIGTVTQNCIHPDGSPGKKFMETDADNNSMHILPYEICPNGPHPKTA